MLISFKDLIEGRKERYYCVVCEKYCGDSKTKDEEYVHQKCFHLLLESKLKREIRAIKEKDKEEKYIGKK